MRLGDRYKLPQLDLESLLAVDMDDTCFLHLLKQSYVTYPSCLSLPVTAHHHGCRGCLSLAVTALCHDCHGYLSPPVAAVHPGSVSCMSVTGHRGCLRCLSRLSSRHHPALPTTRPQPPGSHHHHHTITTPAQALPPHNHVHHTATTTTRLPLDNYDYPQP